MKRLLVSILLTLVSCGFLIAQEPEHITVAGANLRNMYKIDEGLYRSEQPGYDDFAALEKYGIKEVLNLRYWHSDNEETEGIPIETHRVRLHAHDIEDYDIAKALKIVKDRKGPLLFHCRHGSDRTGVLCAMYRIIFQGWSKDDAIKELTDEKFGYHKIYINITQYIRHADIDKIKLMIRQ